MEKSLIRIYYSLAEPAKGRLTLSILDSTAKIIRAFSNEPIDQTDVDGPHLTTYRGLNRFVWDLRWPSPRRIPGVEYYESPFMGPMVPPGRYEVRLSADGHEGRTFLDVKSDPRVPSSAEELNQKCKLQLEIRDTLTLLADAIVEARGVRRQLVALRERIGNDPKLSNLVNAMNAIKRKMAVEKDALAQEESHNYSTAPYHYGSKLDSKLANLLHIVDTADGVPTLQSYEVFRALKKRVEQHLRALDAVFSTDVSGLNEVLRKSNLPLIKKSESGPRGPS